MASGFDLRVDNTNALVARLGDMSAALRSYVGQAIYSETEAVKQAAAARMAELFKNPALMQGSLSTDFEDNGSQITGTAMASGLPYLAIHEYGGVTRPHDILPVNAMALAFFGRGSAQFRPGAATGPLVFAKAVHHPGSVMPERSYLRYALAQRRGAIRSALLAATQQATNQ